MSTRRRNPPRSHVSLLVLALASATLSGCRAVNFLNSVGKERLDLGRMESDIRSSLQRRIESDEHSTGGSVASVGTVRCRERSEIAATCLARVTRQEGRRLVRVEVSIDPDTGGYTWEVVN